MLGTCIGFIWFHSKIHLNITQHAHPAEDEAQVTLIVVITVIVAIAGQTSYMMTSTQFSRISLEFFIRSSHGTTFLKPLSMYCVIMKQFQLLETALQDTILLIGPHGFDSFLLWVGGSGGLQSFLLIRELIRERLPQPLDTPELIELSRPSSQQGVVRTCRGVEFGRDRICEMRCSSFF